MIENHNHLPLHGGESFTKRPEMNTKDMITTGCSD